MSKQQRPQRKTRAKQHAEVERLSIMGTVWRAMPFGFQFYAQSYLTAAQALPESKFDPARLYLLCHAVELALKAFLSLREVPATELAEAANGHNLHVLLDRCEASGLKELVALKQAHRSAIHLASDYYAEKVFEYPALFESLQGYPRSPPFEPLMQAAEFLVKGLHKPCLDAE